MCEKCEEIDGKIALYRSTIDEVTDTLAIELLGLVITDFEAEKKSFHPEQDE